MYQVVSTSILIKKIKKLKMAGYFESICSVMKDRHAILLKDTMYHRSIFIQYFYFTAHWQPFVKSDTMYDVLHCTHLFYSDMITRDYLCMQVIHYFV